MRKNYANNARIPALGYGAVQKKDESQVARSLAQVSEHCLHNFFS